MGSNKAHSVLGHRTSIAMALRLCVQSRVFAASRAVQDLLRRGLVRRAIDRRRGLGHRVGDSVGTDPETDGERAGPELPLAGPSAPGRRPRRMASQARTIAAARLNCWVVRSRSVYRMTAATPSPPFGLSPDSRRWKARKAISAR